MYNNYSNYINTDDRPKYNKLSNASNSPRNIDSLFDYNDKRSVDDDDNIVDKEVYKNNSRDSSFNSNKTSITITRDTTSYYTTKVDIFGELVEQNYNADKLGTFGEAMRTYKVLCYNDICLWIVQNPK